MRGKLTYLYNLLLSLGIGIFLFSPVTKASLINMNNNNVDLPKLEGHSLYSWILKRILPDAKLLLSVIAIIYIIYYGARMVLSSGNDETIKKSKLAITYAGIGFLIINAAQIFTEAFDPQRSTGGDGPNIDRWSDIISIIILGLRYLAGTLAVAWLVLSGFRMVTAAGKEEVLTKQKTQILWSIFELVIVAQAGTFQEIVFGSCNWINPEVCIAEPDATKGVSLLVTIMNMLLTFVVPIGFLLLIIGGMYMILAHGNDTMLNKGKKIVQGTVIALVIIYASYVIVRELTQFADVYTSSSPI